MSKDNISETFNALMPLAVTSMMRETFKKLEWQWKLADQMNAVFLMAMLPVADGMVRALIGPELERRGLKPLQDWHWQVFRQETEAKAGFMAWRDRFDRLCREAAEREIIRRFVWEVE
jgi:hypothetical protein